MYLVVLDNNIKTEIYFNSKLIFFLNEIGIFKLTYLTKIQRQIPEIASFRAASILKLEHMIMKFSGR